MKIDYKRFLLVLAVMLLLDVLMDKSPDLLRGDSLTIVFAGYKFPTALIPIAVAIALTKKKSKENAAVES